MERNANEKRKREDEREREALNVCRLSLSRTDWKVRRSPFYDYCRSHAYWHLCCATSNTYTQTHTDTQNSLMWNARGTVSVAAAATQPLSRHSVFCGMFYNRHKCMRCQNERKNHGQQTSIYTHKQQFVYFFEQKFKRILFRQMNVSTLYAFTFVHPLMRRRLRCRRRRRCRCYCN